MKNTFVVITVTRDEARIWQTGIAPKTRPEKILALEPVFHRHRTIGEHDRGRDTDLDDPAFFDSIAEAVRDAGEILLIGHSKGKASAMLRLVQYWERKYPELAKKVVDALDSNLVAITDGEILAMARDWFDAHLIR